MQCQPIKYSSRYFSDCILAFKDLKRQRIKFYSILLRKKSKIPYKIN